MNTITLTEHAAILYGIGFTLIGSLAGILSYRFALWIQSSDREWRRRQQDMERSTEAYRQHCEREYMRSLARKVRPE